MDLAFLGTNIQTNEEVAIKLVSIRIQMEFLPFSVYIEVDRSLKY